MSKRFGRNQRRRAREALADREERILQLGSALDMQRGLAKHLRERLDELQQVLEDAVEIAGPMSVLFFASTAAVDFEPRRTLEVPAKQVLSSDECMQLKGSISATFGVQRLPVMLAHIDRDALDRAVHLMVEFNGKKVGYAASESALQLRRGEFMERELLRVLPKVIDHHLFGVSHERHHKKPMYQLRGAPTK